jgi:phage shock protein A
MADNLRTRVARIIAGSAHALLDKIEDTAPMAVFEQSVRELELVIDEVRSELGLIVANRHLAQQQHLHLNKEHDSLSVALATALSESRDDLAKPAIARQIDIEAQLPILESSLSELGQRDKELSSFVDALMGKKREMQKAIEEFEASRRVSASAATSRGLTNGAVAKVQSVQSAFDRTYQRQTGLRPAAHEARLDQAAKLNELNQLVLDNKIGERLAALKAGQ